VNGRVTLFSGGRGGASIAGQLLRTPGVTLSIVVNGYDNGHSTGALRRYLPGMLGPSDFRKNLLLHLEPGDPAQAALRAVLAHRFPPAATRADLDRLAGSLATPDGDGPFAALPAPARAAVMRDLEALRQRLDSHPAGLDLADCALGNLILAGSYLRAGGDFNAAVRACARTFGSPARLVNVTGGENAFLTAVKVDGQLLADEAEIVAPQDATAIADLFLLAEPVTDRARAELAGLPLQRVRQVLTARRAQVTLSRQARDAIVRADLIVYGPGTPHSSLLPSYLTPGIADAITASRARARVFVVNLHADHDVRGLGPAELVGLTLRYLGDPANDRHTITHVLAHEAVPAETPPPGACWVSACLVDPGQPDVHCGRRTVEALARVAGAATSTRNHIAASRDGPVRLAAGRRVWFCDLDGTLVDSAPAHEAAFREALAELAPGLLGSFHYRAHAGRSTREVVAELGAGAELAARLVRRKQQLYRGYVEAGMVTAFPDAHRLLDQLARRGHPTYLVTSGSRGSVEHVLAACSLRGRFRGVLTGDDVASSKPDPAVYREACRLWDVDPQEAVVVEDSDHGVTSALRAGLIAFQVRAGRTTPGAVAVRHLGEIASLLERDARTR
jgi:HAD superfamily hydrolase (TIGR01509 family)